MGMLTVALGRLRARKVVVTSASTLRLAWDRDVSDLRGVRGARELPVSFAHVQPGGSNVHELRWRARG